MREEQQIEIDDVENEVTFDGSLLGTIQSNKVK